MSIQFIECPNCGCTSHTGNHDEGYEKTGNEFVSNTEIFKWRVLYGCISCGHVWVNY